MHQLGEAPDERTGQEVSTGEMLARSCKMIRDRDRGTNQRTNDVRDVLITSAGQYCLTPCIRHLRDKAERTT